MSSTSHLEKRITQFTQALKRGQLQGSFAVSRYTAEIMRLVVATTKWSNARSLLENIKAYGRRLIEAKPLEVAIGNTVRRVLYIVREEYTNSQIETEEKLLNQSGTLSSSGFFAFVPRMGSSPNVSPSGQQKLGVPQHSTTSPLNASGDFFRRTTSRHTDITRSLARVFEEDDKHGPDFSRSYANLRQSILDAIHEMSDELLTFYGNIAEQAVDHVHANEVIMTFGKSRTVQEFLLAAAKNRKFQVIVAESAPSNSGHEMALFLSKRGIDTTVIPDASIFAIMARVNKVIVGTHAVMANGGLLALSGMHMLAIAAKHHSVPFVVCAGLYKLCPLYAHDQDTFNEMRSPDDVFSHIDAQRLGGVCVKNPTWDYIPPELVGLFLTPQGGHNPSYVYRLLAELYHPEDMDLDPRPVETVARESKPAVHSLVDQMSSEDEEDEEESVEDEEDSLESSQKTPLDSKPAPTAQAPASSKPAPKDDDWDDYD